MTIKRRCECTIPIYGITYNWRSRDYDTALVHTVVVFIVYTLCLPQALHLINIGKHTLINPSARPKSSQLSLESRSSALIIKINSVVCAFIQSTAQYYHTADSNMRHAAWLQTSPPEQPRAHSVLLVNHANKEN